MTRYKVMAEIVVDAATEADAIWYASEYVLRGKKVVGCSVEACEEVVKNYAAKGPNAHTAAARKRALQRLFSKLPKVTGHNTTASPTVLPKKSHYRSAIVAIRMVDGGEERYSTTSEAAKLLKVTGSSINMALNGYTKSSAKRVWRYADE